MTRPVAAATHFQVSQVKQQGTQPELVVRRVMRGALDCGQLRQGRRCHVQDLRKLRFPRYGTLFVAV